MAQIQPPHEQLTNESQSTTLHCEISADGCLDEIKVKDEYWIVYGEEDDIITCLNPACTHKALEQLSKEDA